MALTVTLKAALMAMFIATLNTVTFTATLMAAQAAEA